MKFVATFCVLVSLILSSSMSLACSTFSLNSNEDVYMAKSYDWYSGVGLLMTNKRHMQKAALLLSEERPAEWVSKYGSVTFNQYGREFPIGGVNEAGLVVESFWLRKAQYPYKKNHPTLNELQWIQYQLDNFKTVKEVAASIDDVQIDYVYGKLHYKVCDASGECAAIEFLRGRPKVYMGEKFKHQSLTNTRYKSSVRYLRWFRGFGGLFSVPRRLGSKNRFVRVTDGVKKFNPDKHEGLAYSFANLEGVRVSREDREDSGLDTQWQLVYSLKDKSVNYRTSLRSEIKQVSIDEFNYDCKETVKVLDINADIEEGQRHGRFTDFTYDQNYKTVVEATELIKDKLPPGVVELIARYPEEATRCMESQLK